MLYRVLFFPKLYMVAAARKEAFKSKALLLPLNPVNVNELSIFI